MHMFAFLCLQMFRTAILALCLGSAAAFVPPKAASTGVVTKATYENEVGVLPPVGFFDPLGLSENLSPEIFEQYRTAELKHGRIAQLAIVGYVVPEIYRWPGNIASGIPFASIPHGVAAIDAIPAFGWIQMIFAIGAVVSCVCFLCRTLNLKRSDDRTKKVAS